MKTRELTKVSLCIALLCVSSYIAFPLPFTPAMVTAQTIVINLVAIIMIPKHAFITVGVYLLLGICGLPVFSGGTAGLAKILGPSGGFLIGYWIAAAVMSFIKEKLNITKIRGYLFLTVIAGMPIIYLFGTIGMCIVQKVNFIAAMSMSVLPFVFGDLFKCVVSAYIGTALNKVFASQRAMA